MAECTVENLKRGVEKGVYRKNIDVDFISKLYFLGIDGINDETLFPVSQFSKIQLMEDYLEYHLRGIVTPKGLQTLNKFINENSN